MYVYIQSQTIKVCTFIVQHPCINRSSIIFDARYNMYLPRSNGVCVHVEESAESEEEEDEDKDEDEDEDDEDEDEDEEEEEGKSTGGTNVKKERRVKGQREIQMKVGYKICFLCPL